MTWSTLTDLRTQVERLWDKGRILSDLMEDGELFPLTLRLLGPDSGEWSRRFEEARGWARSLDETTHLVVVKERRRHPTLGENEFPVGVLVESREQAMAWIEKQEQAQCFLRQVQQARERCPEIVPWLAANPLKSLDFARDWERLLNVAVWYRSTPRPGIFLRELDLPGIDTKFLETYRSLLAAWFDLLLDARGEKPDPSGPTGFEARYGFREKPKRVRFRILDPGLASDTFGGATDIELDAEAFARWNPMEINRVFVLENEVTFLAFPPQPRSIAIFGSGYGFERLGKALWMREREVFYWGDLDTHGFAILDGFRLYFPMARSILMDRSTLLEHRDRWSLESKPSRRDLNRLELQERDLFEDLVAGTFDENVRLEQERIGIGKVTAALAAVSQEGAGPMDGGRAASCASSPRNFETH
jgi:hypothetical protein